jgi:rhodanese-related sulfurtransferase
LEYLSGQELVLLLDVRTQAEYDQGHIAGAVLIPNTELSRRAPAELPDKDALIILYCRSGNRSATATRELADLGYSRVYDLGGIIDWPYDIVS